MFSQAGRSESKRLAVLIDADNANARIIEPLLREVAKYGDANVKRIYGDWASPNLGPWRNALSRFALQPIQQCRYAVGKNASDIALTVDAMDLLHSGNLDGFCIVSSDSDFTRLACRLRESGICVYGFGEKKTPEPFVNACDRFVYVENLVTPGNDPPPSHVAGAAPAKSSKKSVKPLGPEQKKRIRAALDDLAPQGQWTLLSAFGKKVRELSPPIHYEAYGHGTLSKMIDVVDGIRLEDRPADGKSGQPQRYVMSTP